jgi:hypothetical protein
VTPLPNVLREALRRAGYASLSELGRAAGYADQTLRKVRCGALSVSPAMAVTLGALLEVPAALVEPLLRVQPRRRVA